MNWAIYKYPVQITDEFTVAMPAGARPLHVDMQNDDPCLWALVDRDASIENKPFRLFGTGHWVNNPDALKFVGTFQMHGGSLVFHLFEVLR